MKERSKVSMDSLFSFINSGVKYVETSSIFNKE